MPPLTSAERLALAALVVAWAVPAWWLGASTVYGQAFAVAAGAVSVGLALRVRSHPSPARCAFRPLPAFVVFCTVAFLALLLCQALNPDRILIPNRRPVGLLLPLDHLAWLPSGIAGPFDRLPNDLLLFTNAWRHLLIAGAALLPLAALALLPHRPAVLRRLLGLLFVHAVLFSTFAFVHNLSGSKAVLWLVTDANFHLGAPQFPFKNQQAAYQILLLSAALAAWFAPVAVRPWSELKHREAWLAAGTALVFLGTVTTRSRAGLAAAGLLVIVSSALALWPHRQAWSRHRRAITLGTGALLGLAALLALTPPVRTTLGRVAELSHESGDLLVGGSFRRILHNIAWEMTLDRPWFGHGAGCYLPLFTTYRPRVPAYMTAILRDHPDTNRPVHTHADGDWIEFTAEYGLVGTALLAAPWLAWLVALWRTRPLGISSTLLAVGPVLVLAHGWIDFVLRNPAILAAAASLALFALRLAIPVTTEPSPIPA